jgi:hypothetical protein
MAKTTREVSRAGLKADRQSIAKTPAIISLSKWLRDMGRSDTTGWRWCRAAWLHPVNIAGRPYLTREDIQQFQARAARANSPNHWPAQRVPATRPAWARRLPHEAGQNSLANRTHRSSVIE